MVFRQHGPRNPSGWIIFAESASRGWKAVVGRVTVEYLVSSWRFGFWVPSAESFQRREAPTMLQVACPSCGERGGISAEQVGIRIKCRKCGQAFRVAGPAPKVAAGSPRAPEAAPSADPSPTTLDGIVVDGLDDAWTAAPPSTEPAPSSSPAITAEAPPAAAALTTEPRPAPAPHGGSHKEYKLLSSRDKIFEGRFDLPRMEEVINQLAREGWTAKTMCLPHIKNFQGVLQEEVVVLLER